MYCIDYFDDIECVYKDQGLIKTCLSNEYISLFASWCVFTHEKGQGMALTINTNLSSLIVQKNLSSATTSLNNAIERMSTGYKINHAKDNAAGYSIAANWKTMLGSLDVASDNASMGADLLKTAEENYSLRFHLWS